MTSAEQPTRPPGKMFNVGLGIVFALGILFTAFMFMTSWGGTSWMFGSAVSIVMTGLALLRERHKLLISVAGLVVTAAAVAVSLKVGDDLPQEPAPVTAFALAVLVGSALRTLPAGPAAVIALGGIAVTVVPWTDGLSGVTALATTAMIIALVLGPVLRGLDSRALATARTSQDSWAGPPHS